MNKEEQIEFIKDNYPATHHISKRRVRHNFFSSIKTELQAYLLGFYTADGSIDEKRKTLRVELQKGDSEIVYLFKDNISEDARLYQTKERDFIGPKGKIIHAHGNIGVDITSAQLCQDLVNLGIGYRKSYEDLKLPNIDKSLIRHFIRGYFDGDGWAILEMIIEIQTILERDLEDSLIYVLKNLHYFLIYNNSFQIMILK